MACPPSLRPVASALAAGALAGAVGTGAAADSTVRCTCPTVRADGFGASACSANESANRCRVEFNQFPDEAVLAAANALKQAGEPAAPLLRPRDEPSGEFYARLAALDEDARAHAVLVYIAVAAARSEAWSRAQAEALARVVVRDAAARRRVAEAFGRAALEGAAKGGPPTTTTTPAETATRGYGAARDELDTAPGCVAVKVGADWYMYKAPWSPVRTQPQCGGGR